MDARLPQLETVRARKADAAQAEFLRARRHFAHAAHIVDQLVLKRAQAEKHGDDLARKELASILAGTVGMSAISALHEGVERRQAALQAMDAEIARATAERESLRQKALEQQRRFHEARKVSKKLELLVDTLRTTEKSLQTRLSESRADSALKDKTTGRWKLLQTDQ